jgi:secondary thiamine-phosphate synthase enzyme
MSDPIPASWTFAPAGGLLADVRTLTLRTLHPVQILDLTPQVALCVRDAGLVTGLVSVSVLHTTAGLVVNENEPLLLEDLERMLARLAPQDAGYRHDDMGLRFPPPPPDERRNGHAHCRAALLRSSETLHVRAGALVLGRWQRLLLAELDGPQQRSLSIALLGCAQPAGDADGLLGGSGGRNPRSGW